VHREINLIWFSPWTYTKVLFLLVRYLTFADTFLLLYIQLFLNVPAHICRFAYPTALWVVALKMSFAEIILAIRTWAVWHRNKVICVILAITMVGNLVVQCAFMSISTVFIADIFQEPMYPGFRGCNFGQFGLKYGGEYLPFSYMGLAGVEAIVLILMIISAYMSYRLGSTSKLLEIIHRDGKHRFAILFRFLVGELLSLVRDSVLRHLTWYHSCKCRYFHESETDG